jgi:hypothetical protein
MNNVIGYDETEKQDSQHFEGFKKVKTDKIGT